MYSSSASPHTSRPARSQHDARTRPPLSHPVAPPRRRAPSWLILRPPCPRPHTTRPARALSFPHPPLSRSRRSITSFTRTLGASPAPQLDAKPAPSHSPRTSRPARAQLFRSHDPRAPPLPLLPPRLAAATARRRQRRDVVLHSQGHRMLFWSASKLPRPRGQYSLQLAPFFFYP